MELEEMEYMELCSDEMVVNDSTYDKWHQRNWRQNLLNDFYCASYNTENQVSLLSSSKRLELLNKVDLRGNYWGSIYNYLAVNSLSEVSFLADSLNNIAINNQLSKLQLADLVVSFVQDIPYSFVLNFDCKNFKTEGKPCIGNIPFGIVSPYEFIHNLYGDCDTRAVLLFTMLSYLKFNVAILVSDQYAHALIGLALNGTGDYITYKKHKYYFWETTAKGWPLGMLPPEMNNKKYWNVSLVNEL